MPNEYSEYTTFFKNLDLIPSNVMKNPEKGFWDMTRNLLVIGPHANAKTLTVGKSIELLAET
jgi:hypothetical protein